MLRPGRDLPATHKRPAVRFAFTGLFLPYWAVTWMPAASQAENAWLHTLLQTRALGRPVPYSVQYSHGLLLARSDVGAPLGGQTMTSELPCMNCFRGAKHRGWHSPSFPPNNFCVAPVRLIHGTLPWSSQGVKADSGPGLSSGCFKFGTRPLNRER